MTHHLTVDKMKTNLLLKWLHEFQNQLLNIIFIDDNFSSNLFILSFIFGMPLPFKPSKAKKKLSKDLNFE